MNQQEMDEHFMQLALQEAKKAAKIDEVPVGAVLVDDQNQVIVKGHNEKEKKQQATKHAEVVVIEKASKKLNTWHLENSTLYVTLEPCLMCCGAIIQSRISRVVYGAYDPKGGMVTSNLEAFRLKSNHSVQAKGGILEAQCGKILSDYFKAKRK